MRGNIRVRRTMVLAMIAAHQGRWRLQWRYSRADWMSPTGVYPPSPRLAKSPWAGSSEVACAASAAHLA